MKKFNYDLDYKKLDFTEKETRKLFRIGRGEQGVLLVRPQTNLICTHWAFKDEETAKISSSKIQNMFNIQKEKEDFIGMDMTRKFLEMGFTRARRQANHQSGLKQDKSNGKIIQQEMDWKSNIKAKAAKIFKEKRELVANDPVYQLMRKQWRNQE